MSRLEIGIAWRYMRSRRGSRLLSLISLIAVGGVLVGVSALIVIIGVMNGLQNDLREKILVASPDIRVLPFGTDMVMPEWREVMGRVQRQPDVVAVAPFVYTQALVSAVGHSYYEGVFVQGILPVDSATVPVTQIRAKAIAGDFSFATPPREEAGDSWNGDGLAFAGGAVLGDKLAAKLQVTPGVSEIILLSINTAKINPLTGQPQAKQLRYLVTGIFETGMYEYDNSYVFLSLRSAQDLIDADSAVTGLEVRTTDRAVAPAVADSIQASLGLAVRTEDWQDQNSSLFQALELEKLGMTFILLLIILVAAFNIVGTLSMVVTDKTREIGILRAMGMTAASIRRIFFAQGMIIGVTGTLAGLVLGLVASIAIDRYRLIPLEAEVYFIDHLPVTTEWLDVALIVLASMAIAALATVYPARQAARLYPVEAIRHE